MSNDKSKRHDMPIEFKLLLACAVGDSEKLKNLLNSVIDWQFFIKLAIHHRVYPLVYKALSPLEHPSVPEFVVSNLRNLYKKNTLKSLTLTASAAVLSEKLKEQGIETVILKGPALAMRLYGDIAMRPFRDIDILIAPSDVSVADSLLLQLGYKQCDPIDGLTAAQKEHFVRNTHHYEYLHPDTRTRVELHWRLRELDVKMSDFTFEKTNQVPLSGSSVSVPNDDDLLLYLLFHGARHAWFRLRWLVDIAELIKSPIDWDLVARKAEANGISHIFHQGMALAELLLGVTVPERVRAACQSDTRAGKFASLALDMITVTNKEIRTDETKVTWGYFLLEKRYLLKFAPGSMNLFNAISPMFRPTVADFQYVRIPDRLMFLYYVLRPFFVIYRKMFVKKRELA